MSCVYAEVIGDPIAHSKSPLIHNFWLKKLGIDAEYRAFHVKSEDLAHYLAQRREDPDWRGCNVTIPHKSTVLDHLEKVTDSATLIGASNCIYRLDDTLAATNTDVIGVRESLRFLFADREPADVAAIIIGAGGAARAAAYALWSIGCPIDFVARNADSARKIADDLAGERSEEIDTMSFEQFQHSVLDQSRHHRNTAETLLIINASPLGMAGMVELTIDLDHVAKSTVVFDMVYAPLETRLLANARKYGLTTIDGLDMLIGQAAAAFAYFFGQPAPRDHDAELRALLTQ